MKKWFNASLKIGHRGCGTGYAENTMLSFWLAFLRGATGIEYDVRMTGDGQLVLMHDEWIDRTTNGTGKVSDFTYTELYQFNAGYKEHIPLLEKVLRYYGGRSFQNIELKEASGEDVLSLIMQYGLKNSVLVSAFNWDDLAPLAEAEIPTALLADKQKIDSLGEDGFITQALIRNAAAINPQFTAVTKSLVDFAKEAGLLVYPWTVDEKDDIALMKKYSVNGIISNRVELL